MRNGITQMGPPHFILLFGRPRWKSKAIIFSCKQLQSLDLCIEINAPKFGGLVSSVLPVNTLDLLHVLIWYDEIKQLQILMKPINLWGLWYNNSVSLDSPPENDLCCCLVIFLSQGLTNPIVEKDHVIHNQEKNTKNI